MMENKNINEVACVIVYHIQVTSQACNVTQQQRN